MQTPVRPNTARRALLARAVRLCRCMWVCSVLCGVVCFRLLLWKLVSCPARPPHECAAGELMQSERDALLKLIQSLRHEYEAVQAAKMGQESEIQGLKVQPFPPQIWSQPYLLSV